MCGIAAVFEPRGNLPGSLQPALAQALHHRGPDGEGSARCGPALLIHTRLAIVDPAGGAQPLRSEDGNCVAVVNGEIYNHRALRAELEARGHRFSTQSDSEVIVHGYEEYGADVVRKLNGIFAFALWDDRRQTLVAARDPFGVKPLYWSSDGRRVALASEVRALLASGLVTASPDPIAIDHLLAWRFVPAPRTAFAGVSKLPPASILVVEDGRPRVTSYRSAPGPSISDATVDELASELRMQIQAAVARQMMSDVPYGAFLSGGVDSAAVVASMRRASAEPPLTFTIGFPDQRSRDESDGAAQTARELGAVHAATMMRERDFADEIRDCLMHLEEPCGSQSAPALLALSRFAARSVKVVLSGQGADEPLGGYKRAQAAVALRWLEAVPQGLARPLIGATRRLPRNERAKRAALLLQTEPGLERLLRVFEITPPELRARLTGGAGEAAAEERRALARGVLADVADRDPLEQALYLDTRLVLPDSLLLYGDKMSMAASLEHRVPFLDVELMRFVERMPARIRMRWGVRKWLYRRAMSGFVPQGALERPKQGFTTPYDRWMRSSLGAAVAERYAPGTEAARSIDGAVVARLVREHRARRDDHKRILYCLLELAEWHSVFVGDGASGAPTRSARAVRSAGG
jgi:asparagine synthase (glutamine-hydrolysing)